MFLTKRSRIIAVVSMIMSICYAQADTTAADTSQLFIYEKADGILSPETTALIDKTNATFQETIEKIEEKSIAWNNCRSFNREASSGFAKMSDGLLAQATTLFQQDKVTQQLVDSARKTAQVCKENEGSSDFDDLTESQYALITHCRLRSALCKESCDKTFHANMAAIRECYAKAQEKEDTDSLAREKRRNALRGFVIALDSTCDSLSNCPPILLDDTVTPEVRDHALQAANAVMHTCKSYMNRLDDLKIDDLKKPFCPDAINAHIRLLATLKTKNNPGLWAKLKALVTGQQK